MEPSDDEGQPPEHDYKVGYGNPPKHSQFKKGQSGNPKGRPPNPGFHYVMSHLLDEDVVIKVQGETKAVPCMEAILRRLFTDCITGKREAMGHFIQIIRCWGSLHLMAPAILPEDSNPPDNGPILKP